jgi:UDP-glucose 4-epimerase
MSEGRAPLFFVIGALLSAMIMTAFRGGAPEALTRDPTKVEGPLGINMEKLTCTDVPFQDRVKHVKADNEKRTLKQKVMVTGSAGFIASHVAEHALKLGLSVVCVDDLSGGFTRNIPEGCIFEQGDVADYSFVKRLFQKHGSFKYIYHLAAYAAEGLSHFIRSYNYKNNLVSSVQLLNEAVNHNASAFVFTSSIAAFGAADILPMREHHPQKPEDPYGVAKHAFELDLKAAKHMFDMDFIIFRPHNVYGPRQNIADKFRNAIGIFMNQIMRGEDMTLFGDGSQSRAFSYIDDVAPLIALSPFMPGARNQDFFVGRDDETTLSELTELVAKAMDVPHKVKHLDARKEVAHAYASHDKLRCIFNPDTPVDLPEGLRRTVAYAKTLGSFEPVGYTKIEVPRNMPPSWDDALKTWSGKHSHKQKVAIAGR